MYHRTIPETVERLRVSRGTVYALIRRGELTTIRVGRRRFVLDTSIDEFLSRHTETARPGGEAA